MQYRKLISLFILAISVGCSPDAAPQATASASSFQAPALVVEAEPTHYHYSPFVVHVAGSNHFDTISFKDVGIDTLDHTPSNPELETLAQAVSEELAQSSLDVQTQVGYDVSLLDPANHKSCDSHHVYVDVWQSSESKWGYSLWSGCGEDDNFAWEQLSTAADPREDLVGQITPVAKALAMRIAKASHTRCFQKNC